MKIRITAEIVLPPQLTSEEAGAPIDQMKNSFAAAGLVNAVVETVP